MSTTPTILTSAIGELGHDVVERHLLSPAGGLRFRLNFLDVCREDPRGSHISGLLFQEAVFELLPVVWVLATCLCVCLLSKQIVIIMACVDLTCCSFT